MSDKTKAFVIFSAGYIVTAVLCIAVIKKAASKAIDVEYEHLVEKYKL